ncbi:MAG TPA: amylo-alpha-1,6-glucosidase [Sphingobacteriaceae bacterium]
MLAEEFEPLSDKFHTSPDVVNTDDRVNLLNHSNTFGLFDRWGNIYPHGKMVQGIYHDGTRFLNKLILTISNQKPLLLGSTIKEDNDILSVDLTNPALDECNIQDNTIHISRSQFIREGGYFEEITCYHYGDQECSFELNLTFNADFKDIFEIRGLRRENKVHQVTYSDTGQRCDMHYVGLDEIIRKTVITFDTEIPYSVAGNRAVFFVRLEPRKLISIRYCIQFLQGEEERGLVDYHQAKRSIQLELSKNRSLFADLTTSNEQFNHWLNRSRVDLLSLLANTTQGQYPYAGVPWYNTPFGRDGIITAFETLWLAPVISRDVLLFLASKQATALIPEKDAEPGKILHEARRGEMANTGEIPFKEYYGTIDATPLFIFLAGKYLERTNDLELIQKIWPNILAALNWIDQYGDVDGDGFVEYRHKAKHGLTNQGWKDSFDSIMDETGQLAEPPIALAEVQGYTYAAKQYASRMAEILGEKQRAEELLNQAQTLKKKFNEQFWDEELQYFVLALDGNKKPCKVISSNPGHCLFTGIVDHDKAAKLAEGLLSPKMFSGWGIRTLASGELRYNPMSYHNGSVWPHDNALIAYGLSIYGFQEKVFEIMKSIFDASFHLPLQRLPELYCGFNRRSGEGPTAYPVACSPQAWSVAVVFMLLQACLRIEINALAKTITFDNPRLPDYLDNIVLTNLTLDGSSFNLKLHRLDQDVAFNVMRKPHGWEVIIKK